MRKLFAYGGIAASVVLVAFGAGAIGIGVAGDAFGAADPGEIVWAWVAYEDDPGQAPGGRSGRRSLQARSAGLSRRRDGRVADQGRAGRAARGTRPSRGSHLCGQRRHRHGADQA